ncbi:uncharacterized protein [Venturia canescens]|uniref:uncharacterized protein n=1 Tax=Venturia canescens TaxID=32260 RepID=UPI001C9CD02B|nr:uncharacterized protein LOC122407875 [Venturia canescens]XP_043270281.1 uncharacterized protein LOC122407875 [Venturia canescens]
MSHSVTIRTATVTTNASPIFVNTTFLKTYSGILKVLELILGIVCVGIIGHDFDNEYRSYNVQNQFFFLITTTFMIATFLLLLSCMVSLSTESIISKTIYEVVYHAAAFGLLLAASLTLLIKVNNYRRSSYNYESLLGASICGLVNSAFYFISTIFALRSYRGL